MPKPRRLLIVNGNEPEVRCWQRFLGDVRLEVGVSATLSDAIRCFELEPWQQDPYDLVLLDLLLPDGNGADLLPFIHALEPRPRVAAISSHLDSHTVLSLFGHCEVMIPKPLDREGVLKVLQILQSCASYTDRVSAFAHRHHFSKRETELLMAAIRGLNNDEAASELGCDRSTVGTYWARIFKKTSTHCQRGVLALIIRSMDGSDAPREIVSGVHELPLLLMQGREAL